MIPQNHITIVVAIISMMMMSCITNDKKKESINKKPIVTAKEILGNPKYQAISYGGYRHKTRAEQPSVEQIKEDLKLLFAMGIRMLRTYNVQLAHAPNVLKAIKELKEENEGFEMYVMLGAWIDCKNAWTDLPPDHDVESEQNKDEIARAVKLANSHPDIVKVIAVGNEAMVKWATAYYVQPDVILKWVTHLQQLKSEHRLPQDLWITSSDDFSSWGGGDSEYHVEALTRLISSVDFISMHTYPMHNTHYNPHFWGIMPAEDSLSKKEKITLAMQRSLDFAKHQYDSVKAYMHSLGIDKPVHIGETGWASSSDGLYGADGSGATDELKQGIYYQNMREWTNSEGISCFFFEAFDEPWKDAGNPNGSENHFGLFKVNGQAKYAIWSLVDEGVFSGLGRGNKPVTKTYGGDSEKVVSSALMPPEKYDSEHAH